MDKKILIGGLVVVIAIITIIMTPEPIEQPIEEQAVGRLLVEIPIIVGSVDINYAFGVFISGNHAFVADGREGLQIIEVFE